MTREELHQLIASVQRQQSELDNLEVKTAGKEILKHQETMDSVEEVLFNREALKR